MRKKAKRKKTITNDDIEDMKQLKFLCRLELKFLWRLMLEFNLHCLEFTLDDWDNLCFQLLVFIDNFLFEFYCIIRFSSILNWWLMYYLIETGFFFFLPHPNLFSCCFPFFSTHYSSFNCLFILFLYISNTRTGFWHNPIPPPAGTKPRWTNCHCSNQNPIPWFNVC